jgi:hypothetical protein
MGFRLEIEFTEHLHIVTIAIHTLYSSLQHIVSLLRLLSSNGFQHRWTLSFHAQRLLSLLAVIHLITNSALLQKSNNGGFSASHTSTRVTVSQQPHTWTGLTPYSFSLDTNSHWLASSESLSQITSDGQSPSLSNFSPCFFGGKARGKETTRKTKM